MKRKCHGNSIGFVFLWMGDKNVLWNAYLQQQHIVASTENNWVCKEMPQCLKSEESVKIVNMIKARALNRCLLKALYDEMGCEQTKLLFHTCFLEMSSIILNWEMGYCYSCTTVITYMTQCMISRGSQSMHSWLNFFSTRNFECGTASEDHRRLQCPRQNEIHTPKIEL